VKRFRAKLVGIAGGSGSGKTTLAAECAQGLGPAVARLSVDDYYRDRSNLSPRRRALLNYDHPRAIDWELLCSHIEKLVRGKPIDVPVYDFGAHARLREIRRIESSEVLLVDGLWTFRPRAMARLFDLKVYVRCPEKERLARRLKRDVQDRARSRTSIEKQYREQVLPMHERFVAPQEKRADFSVKSPVAAADLKSLIQTIRRLE
jgi:uridine kinase